MFCSNCGKQLENDVKFCSNCGRETTPSAIQIKPQTTVHKKTSWRDKRIGCIPGCLIVLLSIFVFIGLAVWVSNTINPKNEKIAKSKQSEMPPEIRPSGLTDDQEIGYQMLTEKLITSMLKSPSTAKFAPYKDWYFKLKDDKTTIIQGYVDSQNAFGAIMRTTFQITLSPETKPSSIIINGEEVLKK